jgi:HlyD family secretion protein
MGMDRVIKKKKLPLGLAVGIATLAALAVLFGYQLLVVDKKPVQATKKSALRIATVKRGPFQEFFLVDAYIAPFKSIYIDSREYGIVEGVSVDRGSIVRKGELLAKLQNGELESQLALKNAELELLKGDLDGNSTRLQSAELENRQRLQELDHRVDLLQDERDRTGALFKAGAVTEAEYTKANKELAFWSGKKELLLSAQQLGLQSIRQDGARIRRSMDQLRIDIARLADRVRALTLLSPAYGQIAAFNASVGESKNVGSRIAQLDILEPLKMKATLDEYYLNKIDIGAKGTFPYPNQKGEDGLVGLTVSWVAGGVKSNAFEIEFSFDGKPPALRIGQRLVIRVAQGKERDALLLEQGQFFQATGGSWVYLLGGEGNVADKRAIVAGKSNPDYLEVLGGLKVGDKVIVSDYSAFGGAERISLK